MDQIRRIPMRAILLLGMISAVLYVLSGFYHHAAPVVSSGSLAGPVVVSLAAMLPLAVFFLLIFLRVTVPRLLQIGALVGAIGAVLQFLTRIGYLTALKAMIFGHGHGRAFAFTAVSRLEQIVSWAILVGILLIGVAFLRHPDPLYARLGLITIVGSGCAIFLSLMTAYIALSFSSTANLIVALLRLVFWSPFFLLLLFLYKGQPAPAPSGGNWSSPCDPPSG